MSAINNLRNLDKSKSVGKRDLLFWVCTLFLLIAICLSSHAQVNLSNYNTYTQNFNSLTKSSSTSYFFNNSTVPGWYLQHESYAWPYFLYYANDGTNTTRNFYSFGSTGSADRALGGMATDINTGSGYVGFRIKNTTGAVIRNFEITYTMEQWFNSGKEAKLDFSYATKPVGTPITSLLNSSATWVHIDEMDVITPATTSPVGAKDGNNDAHRINKKFTINEINLQPNQEIMLRWEYITLNSTNGNGLSLDDVAVTPQINVFYAEQNGSLSNLNAWSRNEDGTGGGPTSFSLPDQVFHITKGTGRKLNGSMVLGTNSKIVLGNGVDLITLDIKKENNPFTGKIDVLNNATLVLNNAISPELGKLSDESTIVFAGNVNGEVQMLTSAVYGNLIVSGSSKKQISQTTLINGNLTLEGSNLHLGNYNLTVKKTKQIIGGSETGYIVTNGVGKLWMTVPRTDTEVVFPVGNSTYNPIVLKQSASGAEDVFKVRVLDGIYSMYKNNGNTTMGSITENSVNRTWLVEESVSGGSDMTMKVYFGSTNTQGGFISEGAYLSHFENEAWDMAQNVGAGSEGTMFFLSRSGITSFSPFGIFSDATLLPIELLSFSASYHHNSVLINWETLSETNNEYFAIEYSTDGATFIPVAKVNGAGNSTQRISYAYNDTRPLQGQVYYRLKQTDFDGKSTYSSIVTVLLPVSSVSQPFPNPVKEMLTLPVIFKESPITVSVTDLAGNFYLRKEIGGFSGNYATLDFSNLDPKIYMVKVQTSEGTHFYKIVKI